jgi:uncharacterized phage protein gp47/JayE
MVTSFTPPSAEQILQQLINNYQAIATTNGYNVAVNPGSEVYTRLSSIAQQQGVFYQIMVAQMDARIPDTATGSDLDRVLNQYGLVRKPATSAQGFIQLIASAPQTLTAGMLLNGPNGLQYQVSVSGVYQPASTANPIQLSYVPVSAVSQGSNTDLGINQVMTWININSLMQSTSPVVVALTGGSDAETDAQARFRLYQVLQNPPNAGNSQFLINLTSNIDPIVQAGFVYPDYNGAGTQLIALMGYQSDGYYIGRDIPHLPTDNAVGGVSPYNKYAFNAGTNLVNDTSAILGQLPAIVANQYASVITTVNNDPVAINFNMQLPYPIGNPINGIGGGWINNYGQTFPTPVSTTSSCAVTVVTSPLNITVNSYSTTAGTDNVYDPVPGITAINWIDRSGGANSGWRIVQSVVQSFTKSLISGNNYAYNIFLNVPLVCGITSVGETDFYGRSQVAVGNFIFPASVNAQNYLNTVMNSFASLGPGQVTNSISLQQIGANRQPAVGSIYTPLIGGNFTQALTNNNPEIYSVVISLAVEQIGSTNVIGVAPAAAVPPIVYIPHGIAWYDSLRIP